MKFKNLLFLGILLLIVGIVFRKMTTLEGFGLMLIISGVICKTIYIVAKARSGEYQPGKELIFLGVGLLLFLSGLYLRKYDEYLFYPICMIVAGLILKIAFIVRFVQILKKKALSDQSIVD